MNMKNNPTNRQENNMEKKESMQKAEAVVVLSTIIPFQPPQLRLHSNGAIITSASTLMVFPIKIKISPYTVILSLDMEDPEQSSVLNVLKQDQQRIYPSIITSQHYPICRVISASALSIHVMMLRLLIYSSTVTQFTMGTQVILPYESFHQQPILQIL